MKRGFDFCFSLLGLIIISPVFIVIIIILSLTGEREVFYLQERVGLNNKPFMIYKFATMKKNSSKMGTGYHTVRNDPRVTSFGKLLRLTKLNELPQILNVLKGDMSLVGPRPLILQSFKKYTEEVQAVIYKNKPGITGIGSLIFRDEEKLVTLYQETGGDTFYYYKTYIFPYKGALEKWYFENVSLLVDLKILSLTFLSLIYDNNHIIYKQLKGIPEKPEMLTKDGILKNNEKK